MIDKLEVRIPASAQLTPAIEALLAGNVGTIFRRDRYYQGKADLQPYGEDAVLHFRQNKNEDHKLSLIKVGKMSLSEMETQIARVFEIDPSGVEIMRLDLAADVENTTVDWFRTHAYVSDARWISEYRSGPELQTLAFGNLPSRLQIYNKTAERLREYRNETKEAPRGISVPAFEERYGHSPDSVVTRVERQFGRSRIPKPLATVGKLRENAQDFNPFAKLKLLPGSPKEICIEDHSWSEYINLVGTQAAVEQMGATKAKKLANKYGGRNAARAFKPYEKFLATCQDEVAPPDLYQTYRQSVRSQLAA